MWLGIVLFGLFHSFIFMPIILSFLGPTPDAKKKSETRRKTFIKKMESMTDNQLKAVCVQYEFNDLLRNSNSENPGNVSAAV